MSRLKESLDLFARALGIWLEANAFALAGSLAFFTLFSLAPVVIVIVSIVGFFYGEEAAHGEVAAQLSELVGPQVAEAVQAAVARSRLTGGGLWATVAGIGAMLLGATTVFGQMQTALNAIWSVAPRPSRSSVLRLVMKRLGSLTLVLAIGFLMLVSLTLSVALNAVARFASGWIPAPDLVLRLADAGLSFAVITALFATIFRVLPDVSLRWQDVALGAVVTALLFSLGRFLIALYLTHTATASTYGAAASLVLLLLWVNYSSLILLFGAAFTRALCEARNLRIRPSAMAVHVRRTLVEDEPPGAG